MMNPDNPNHEIPNLTAFDDASLDKAFGAVEQRARNDAAALGVGARTRRGNSMIKRRRGAITGDSRHTDDFKSQKHIGDGSEFQFHFHCRLR